MNNKTLITYQAQLVHIILGSGLSILLGVLFTFIIGDINASQYLLELMSMLLIEVPFVVLYAILVRKHDWLMGLVYASLGTAASFTVSIPVMSVTPIVFLKIAIMGIILGKHNWLDGSFLRRLTVVAIPGIIIAFVFGLPVVLYGVSPELIEEIKQDTMKIYQAFMSEDDALNTAENAMFLFTGIFKIGLAVYFLFAFTLSWLSYIFAGWIMGKFKEDAEYVPPIYSFKLPFHVIWVFLVGAIFWISGYEPVFLLASNILAIMAGLYGIQGLAIFTYHINGISIGRLPKIFFWVIFFLMIGFFGVFLIIIGIIDNWFNLRPALYFTEGRKEGNNNESNS